MDEVETYRQRLQVIEGRRQQQQEEERLKRWSEEERLREAQKKKQTLRDQWFTEPVRVEDLPNVHREETPEEVQEQEAHVLRVVTDGSNQVSTEADVHITAEMSQRMFHEGGHDGRSVLGMVAVQVERDPKTGATVVRSVVPVSAAPASSSAAATATTVFDDGRRSVRALGGPGGRPPPTPEELGQVLSAVDHVGMRVLLDDVAVTTPVEGRLVAREVTGRGEGGGAATLTFMDYADGDQQGAAAGVVGVGREENGSVLTIERVIITGEGEEELLEDLSDGSTVGSEPGLGTAPLAVPDADGPAGTEARVGAFQEVPLEGNALPGQVADGGVGGKQGGGASNPKACQCCSVM